MGGIIQGFLGGAANAMGEAGKMAFANQLTKERDEANFLRDSELAKTLKREDITSREKISANDLAGRERIAKSRDKTLLEAANVRAAATKAASGANSATTNQRDAAALIAAGYPKDIANAIAHGAMKEIKDESTGEMVLINALTNTPVGRLTAKHGYLAEGELPENAEVLKTHRDAAREAADKKAGYTTSDSTDFPETGGNRKLWIKQEAQRLANKERGDKLGSDPGSGVINNQMKEGMTDQDFDPNKPPGGKAPYPDGTILSRDGKRYRVVNGKPVEIK